MQQPIIFGVRHLSPAGAWHLRQLLNKVRPKLVLIEGPSDLNDEMVHIVNPKTKPPIAIMAYTKEVPIRTILYPFAEYSPEYQAILWAYQNRAKCRFMDLPSSTFLAIRDLKEDKEDREEASAYVYHKLDELSGEEEHETFWERTMEHNTSEDAYLKGAREFGMQLRTLTEGGDRDYAQNIVREAFMKRKIEDAFKEGFQPEEIVVVTGSYHVAGLMSSEPAMTDKEIKSLPFIEAEKTLMPYSYYRLSSRSGYGAGNKAPAYYDLLWKGLCKEKIEYTAYSYLSRIAAYQRNYGHMVSSAEVIEAVRLSAALASLRGSKTPSLRDLRDAAITCMGHGNFSEISLAVADTEIGTCIGSLPEGISRTSIQEDFYRLLEDLRLTKYKSLVTTELQLDLRERLNVKSEKAAFLDLERSFFLHRLRVLGIHFASQQAVNQEKATWAEHWMLQWTPEAEIEIVEAALKGDTVELATSFALKEQVEKSTSIAEIAAIIEDSFLCGMEESVTYAIRVLQGLATDAAAIAEIAETIRSLSIVVTYGSIRHLDHTPLIPILEQLFLRGCLTLSAACICDNNAVGQVIAGMGKMNEAAIAHDFLDGELWIRVLTEIADRDDINTKASGYAAAVLLERGQIDGERLGIEVQRRLSKGVPADLGACWFEGLSMKNRYSLIARMSLWEKLSEYMDSLNDEEFKRALVFLRRAFADFTAREKSDIAENLGELWGMNALQVSEVLNEMMTETEQELIETLDEFNFEDI